MNTQSKRLENTFAALKAENRKALIPFITVGDPAGFSVVKIMSQGFYIFALPTSIWKK